MSRPSTSTPRTPAAPSCRRKAATRRSTGNAARPRGATGTPLFPTLDYGVQLLRPGEATRFKRETASTLYIAIEGEGVTEVTGKRFEWRANDIFVVPGFAWRRHVNAANMDAILYIVSDAPLLDK